MSVGQGQEAREGGGCRQGGTALPSLTGSTTEPGTGPCTFSPALPRVLGAGRAPGQGWCIHTGAPARPCGVASGNGLRPMGGCGDASQQFASFFLSFQLTVEMFDYLECELNLFQTGKPLCCPTKCWGEGSGGAELHLGEALGRMLSESIAAHLFSGHFTQIIIS